MNEDWLRAEPLRHWLATKTHRVPVFGWLLGYEASAYFFSYSMMLPVNRRKGEMGGVYVCWGEGCIPNVLSVAFHLFRFSQAVSPGSGAFI